MRRNLKDVKKLLILLSLTVALSACEKSYKSTAEFNDYLNDSQNGCFKFKSIGKVNIAVKYMPFSYLVLKNLKGNIETSSTPNNVRIDSLLDVQKNFLTFIMTITPRAAKGHNRDVVPVMYDGVEDEAGFTERVFSMNFSLEKYVKLYSNDEYTEPIVAFVENVYELSDGRNFFIMFPRTGLDSLSEVGEVSFVFKDPYFNTGTLQFHFNKVDILKANGLNVAWDKI